MVLQYARAYLNGFPANLAEDCHGNMIKQAEGNSQIDYYVVSLSVSRHVVAFSMADEVRSRGGGVLWRTMLLVVVCNTESTPLYMLVP